MGIINLWCNPWIAVLSGTITRTGPRGVPAPCGLPQFMFPCQFYSIDRGIARAFPEPSHGSTPPQQPAPAKMRTPAVLMASCLRGLLPMFWDLYTVKGRNRCTYFYNCERIRSKNGEAPRRRGFHISRFALTAKLAYSIAPPHPAGPAPPGFGGAPNRRLRRQAPARKKAPRLEAVGLWT